MLSIVNYKTGITIKTGLGYFAIITYTEKIVKIMGWADSMANRAAAKQILDAMVVIEHQHKLFLPTDFEDIWDKMNESIKSN
jgi:hypothetical protein